MCKINAWAIFRLYRYKVYDFYTTVRDSSFENSVKKTVTYFILSLSCNVPL